MFLGNFEYEIERELTELDRELSLRISPQGHARAERRRGDPARSGRRAERPEGHAEQGLAVLLVDAGRVRDAIALTRRFPIYV